MAINFSPPEIWDDGDTFMNNTEDRIGAILVSVFAAILSFWIIPELLKYVRSH